MRNGRSRALVASAFLVLCLAPSLRAEPLKRGRTAANVDWVTAGVGAVAGDSADVVLTGVTGPVTAAYLYWNGIASAFVGTTEYDAVNVTINGNPVTGTAIGDSSTNCWGDGMSRAYGADVTAYVTGDGTYTIAGLLPGPGEAPNGVSLIVLFDDGNPSNNRDLLFFEGNDSNSKDGFADGENEGWHAELNDVEFRQGGGMRVHFHVADGQSFDDGEIKFRGPTGQMTITDTLGLWDGVSVPAAGPGRAEAGRLWDIHTFDITSMFRLSGKYKLYLDGQQRLEDCLAVVLLIFEASAAPIQVCGDGIVMAPEDCDDGNHTNGDCCDATCHFEPVGTLCGTPGDPCLEARCDGEGTCDAEGRSCRLPVAARGAQLSLRNGRRDRLEWTWATGVSTVRDFGADPLGMPAYDLCVFDTGTGSLRLLAHLGIPEGAGWRSTTNGYEYVNPAGPLQRLALQGGLPGRAKIVARAANFESPALPLAPPVMVRLRARDGLCWGANYSVPERNGRRRFRSRSDVFNP